MQYITFTKEIPQQELLTPVQNMDHGGIIKPLHGTGLWTSPLEANGKTAWENWATDNLPQKLVGRDAYVLTPHADARIYVIHDEDSMRELIRTYGLGNPEFYSHRTYLDWERMAKDFDAVTLHEAGFNYGGGYAERCLEWQLPSTVWLNWCFESFEQYAPGTSVPVEPVSLPQSQQPTKSKASGKTMTKRKRTNKQALFFNVNEMFIKGNDVHVNARFSEKVLRSGEKKTVCDNMKLVSENRVFRMFGGSNPDVWENFAIISVGDDVDPIVLDFILLDGFIYEGKRYKRVLRSAAQMRTAKAVFTCLDVEEVRNSTAYGATFGDKTNIAKMEARYGLALSSTQEIAEKRDADGNILEYLKFSYSVMSDFERTVKLAGRMLNEEGVMQDFEKEVTLNTTDGAGFIDYPTAKKIAKDLGLSHVPTAFQVRHAGDKGLLIVWKWDKKKYPGNIIFLDSMHKYEPDTANYTPVLEIAGYMQPARSPYAMMNYQFVQALNITADDLILMAKESLDRIEGGVLEHPSIAMKFLGMIDTTEGEYSDKIVSRLQKTIDAKPEMLNDPYVQRSMKQLLKKFITDMRQGRVPVLGAWRYVAPDPTVVFGNEAGVLAPGEYFYNNQASTVAAFRSPLIHYSEAIRLNTVEKPELCLTEKDGFEYLKDLLVCNTYDDHAPRAGGMDYDGDRMLITADERIVNSVAGGALVFDEGREGIKQANTLKNRIMYDKATFGASRIGMITDWATAWTDAARHLGEMEKFGQNIEILRVKQGQEIDSAKTGFVPEIPNHLILKRTPHWMEKKENFEGKVRNADAKTYQSTSPIGQLYDFIVAYWPEFLKSNPNKEEKRSLEFISKIDKAEAHAIYPYMEMLEEMYRRELGELRQLEQNGVYDETQAREKREEIFDRYSELVANVDADPATVAGVAYNIAYNENGRGGRAISFPWIASFNGMLIAMANIADERFKLVHVRGNGLTAGKMSFANKVCKKNGAQANVANGTYEVIDVDGKLYAKVKRTAKPVLEEAVKQVRETVAFTIKGFKYAGFTATTAFKAIADNGNVVRLAQEGKYISVLAGETKIGVVGQEDDFTVAHLLNKEVVLERHADLTFIGEGGKVVNVNAVAVRAEVKATFVPAAAPAPQEQPVDGTFGIEEVECTWFEQPEGDVIGKVVIIKNGKGFGYFVRMNEANELFLDANIKNPAAYRLVMDAVLESYQDVIA